MPMHSRRSYRRKRPLPQFPRSILSMESLRRSCYGKYTDWNRPLWPGSLATICINCFMTGGPGNENGTNKPPPTRIVLERSKGDTTCPTTSQNPSHWQPSWLNKACTTTRKNSESKWLAKDDLETNPIIIKPETEPYGRAVLLASLTQLLSTWVSFPNKIPCFVSTCVSSDNSFPSVGPEPSFGPWKGSAFLQQPHILRWFLLREKGLWWSENRLGKKWLLQMI